MTINLPSAFPMYKRRKKRNFSYPISTFSRIHHQNRAFSMVKNKNKYFWKCFRKTTTAAVTTISSSSLALTCQLSLASFFLTYRCRAPSWNFQLSPQRQWRIVMPTVTKKQKMKKRTTALENSFTLQVLRVHRTKATERSFSRHTQKKKSRSPTHWTTSALWSSFTFSIVRQFFRWRADKGRPKTDSIKVSNLNLLSAWWRPTPFSLFFFGVYRMSVTGENYCGYPTIFFL